MFCQSSYTFFIWSNRRRTSNRCKPDPHYISCFPPHMTSMMCTWSLKMVGRKGAKKEPGLDEFTFQKCIWNVNILITCSTGEVGHIPRVSTLPLPPPMPHTYTHWTIHNCYYSRLVSWFPSFAPVRPASPWRWSLWPAPSSCCRKWKSCQRTCTVILARYCAQRLFRSNETLLSFVVVAAKL